MKTALVSVRVPEYNTRNKTTQPFTDVIRENGS